MKVDMDKSGGLVLTPESYTEQIALKYWQEKNVIPISDVMRNEVDHLRGSAIIIKPFEPLEK